jgi:hypothetical protein
MKTSLVTIRIRLLSITKQQSSMFGTQISNGIMRALTSIGLVLQKGKGIFMKRYFCIFLLFTVCILVLASCKKEANPSETTMTVAGSEEQSSTESLSQNQTEDGTKNATNTTQINPNITTTTTGGSVATATNISTSGTTQKTTASIGKTTTKKQTTQANETSTTKAATTTSTVQPTTQPVATTYNGSLVNGLPVYVDGAIPLVSEDEFEPVRYTRHYRRAYYTVLGEFLGLVPQNDLEKWTTSYVANSSSNVEPTEMMLVSFVKHFNIPRAEFDKGVEALIHHWTSIGVANTNELHEIPNADIIYTFDNKIINEYYRRA